VTGSLTLPVRMEASLRRDTRRSRRLHARARHGARFHEREETVSGSRDTDARSIEHCLGARVKRLAGLEDRPQFLHGGAVVAHRSKIALLTHPSHVLFRFRLHPYRKEGREYEFEGERFGDDAAALLQALEIERADVMGYSQGGGVALQMALCHPERVGKLVTLSATYRRDGWYPSVGQALTNLSGDLFTDTPVGEAFRQHTTDPASFDAYIEKMRVLNLEDQQISDAQMRSIRAKTMVIVGDADGVKPEHAVAMFRLRGGGDEEAAATGTLSRVPSARLVILPATSHISISAAAQLVEPMITAFLDDVPPANPSLW